MDQMSRMALESGELTPQFINRQEEALFAEAMLGQNAIDFLNSDLGRLLRGYALQELMICQEKLLKTPFWRWRKIIKLQQRAAVAQQFVQFVYEAIQHGEVAEQNMKQMRINQ